MAKCLNLTRMCGSLPPFMTSEKSSPAEATCAVALLSDALLSEIKSKGSRCCASIDSNEIQPVFFHVVMHRRNGVQAARWGKGRKRTCDS